MKDTVEVLEYVAERFANTSIIVVGHSMGGSIATKALQSVFEDPGPSKSRAQVKGSVVVTVSAFRDRRRGRSSTRGVALYGQHRAVEAEVVPHSRGGDQVEASDGIESVA